jgi:hypothetical protein
VQRLSTVLPLSFGCSKFIQRLSNDGLGYIGVKHIAPEHAEDFLVRTIHRRKQIIGACGPSAKMVRHAAIEHGAAIL